MARLVWCRSIRSAQVAFIALLAARASAASPEECAALASPPFPPDATALSTTWMPADAATSTPEHCRVEGNIGPGTIGFALQLPTAWNRKLYHQGGGGFVGAIPDAIAGLRLGYATAATDTGHRGNVLDASWALDNPQARVDFGYRAVHVTTTTAKALLASYYGSGPSRSYFVGCSRGGGQGLMEAQRFPEDFDGLVVAAPAFDWTEFMVGFNWNSRAVSANPIPLAKLTVIENAVLQNCDAEDGVVDGLVQDPRRCSFDPASLLCTSGDGPDCLTAGQVAAVRAVYSGPHNSAGERITHGFPSGAEGPVGGWEAWISGDGWTRGMPSPPLQYLFQDGFLRYFVYNDPSYDPFTFDYDQGPATLAQTSLLTDATDPDLTALKARGGKIVMWHGWNDHALSALKTISYYHQVIDTLRGNAGHGERDRSELPRALANTTDFIRLFLAPGMHHCGGGPGMTTFDAFGALVNWVENGIAPDRLVATGASKPGVSRPLCPYPLQPVYKGGDVNSADSFACELRGADPRRGKR
ncbi:MAG TPA: tannase/feruloyl esterase family alpha/beta hydrolase [Myxococcaceae bacterium]|jgi:feruloyl esterase|nr:tannase/feruloyl esterase family alpha/beta hydrolase [Myxococcaceae bacterium]